MTTPVSSQEFQAQSEGRLPAAEEVAEGVWTLPQRNRPGHMPFTLCYLIADSAGGIHVLDPGWDLDGNAGILEAALTRLGAPSGVPVSAIVTHLHPDHTGLAGRLKALHGSRVVMHRREHEAQQAYASWVSDRSKIRADLERWAVPAGRFEEVMGYAAGSPRVVVPADQLVEDGELLQIPGRRLRVLHTPGHTPGHLCLVDEDRRLLFSGDQLLPRVTPGMGAAGGFPGNPLELYLQSLQRLSAYDDCENLPGHEYRYRGIAARARAIARRHLIRTAEVERVLLADPGAAVWQTAERLSWGRGWDALTRHYLVSALRQTAMHMALVQSGAHTDAFEAWGRPNAAGPRPHNTQR
ncbi:MBL fold metallo-hydrolase [Arthrobacter sp. NPDC055585]